MTQATAETHSPNLGETDSWADLPSDTPQQKEDKLPDGVKPTPGICAVCGEPIVREPGARGRMPKYHPDCKPTRSTSDGTSTRRRSGKAEAEADTCIAAFQQLVTKTAVMLSVVDRFDAFVVMVALPNICDNLRGILVRYDGIRKEFLAAQTGGSIIGLALALLMLCLPIGAHHGLLGRGQVARLLVEMPFTLMKIQQRLKEGSEALTQMMAEQLRMAQEANAKADAEAQRVRAAQNGHA